MFSVVDTNDTCWTVCGAHDWEGCCVHMTIWCKILRLLMWVVRYLLNLNETMCWNCQRIYAALFYSCCPENLYTVRYNHLHTHIHYCTFTLSVSFPLSPCGALHNHTLMNTLRVQRIAQKHFDIRNMRPRIMPATFLISRRLLSFLSHSCPAVLQARKMYRQDISSWIKQLVAKFEN